MSDLASLGLVIVALALGECAWWVRHGAAVLRAPLYFGRGALATLSSSLGNDRGALALMNPLPPFGRAYVMEPWPFSLSEEGVVAARSFAFGLERRPQGPARLLRWEEIEKVGRDDVTVLVNGAPFATAASRAHAAAAQKALQTLWEASPRERARTLDELLAAHLDAEEVKKRVDRHRSHGGPALLASAGLFVALFGALPWEVAHRGLERWPWLLGLLYAWVSLAALSTWLLHRGLYGPAGAITGATRSERWAQLALMFLAPYTALRATDRAGRNLMAGLHPVAAALALSDTSRGRDALLRALRDWQTPRPLALDAPAAAVEADFRDHCFHVAKKRAEGRGVDLGALTSPPRLSAGQVAWCPRCRVPYRQGGTCADCGVALSSAA